MQSAIDNTLPLMEHFYTVQGEGFYQGHAAYFIRLAGCDVGCTWCDVKESWPAENFPKLTIEEISNLPVSSPSKVVVITGGEPLMYNLDALTNLLKEKGKRTHIETSGAHPFSGAWDWFCLSPKKFKEVDSSNLKHTDELKIIVYNKTDFEFAEKYKKLISEHKSLQNVKLYLQPEWSKREQMIPLINEYVKNNPEWEISLQIHKYMNIP